MKNNFVSLKNVSPKQVSSKQCGILVFIMLIAMRIIMSPNIITESAGRDAYLAFALNAIITSVCIYLICFVVKRNIGLSFDQILKKLFGKIVTKILLVFFLFFFMFKFLIVDYSMETFLLETLYEFLDWKIFILPIFGVIVYAAFKGPRALGRAGQIFVPFAIGLLILVFGLSFFNAKFENLFPVLENGFNPVIKGCIESFAKTGEYLFIFIIADKLVPDKKLTKSAVISSIVASSLVFIFIIFFQCVFGEMAPMLKEGLIKIIQFKRSVPNSFRFDGIIIVLWIPLVIIYAAINFYCAGTVFKKLFNIKSTGVCIVTVAILTYLMKFIPAFSSAHIYEFARNFYAYLAIALQVALPIILAIIVAFKKERKVETKVTQTA